MHHLGIPCPYTAHSTPWNLESSGKMRINGGRGVAAAGKQLSHCVGQFHPLRHHQVTPLPPLPLPSPPAWVTFRPPSSLLQRLSQAPVDSRSPAWFPSFLRHDKFLRGNAHASVASRVPQERPPRIPRHKEPGRATFYFIHSSFFPAP